MEIIREIWHDIKIAQPLDMAYAKRIGKSNRKSNLNSFDRYERNTYSGTLLAATRQRILLGTQPQANKWLQKLNAVQCTSTWLYTKFLFNLSIHLVEGDVSTLLQQPNTICSADWQTVHWRQAHAEQKDQMRQPTDLFAIVKKNNTPYARRGGATLQRHSQD